MESGIDSAQQVYPLNVVPFRIPVGQPSPDESYFAMKEMLFLICESLTILLPREQIDELRLKDPENARCRSRVKGWMKRSLFFRDSEIYRLFTNSGVKSTDAMADIILYEFHLWLLDNS